MKQVAPVDRLLDAHPRLPDQLRQHLEVLMRKHLTSPSIHITLTRDDSSRTQPFARTVRETARIERISSPAIALEDRDSGCIQINDARFTGHVAIRFVDEWTVSNLSGSDIFVIAPDKHLREIIRVGTTWHREGARFSLRILDCLFDVEAGKHEPDSLDEVVLGKGVPSEGMNDECTRLGVLGSHLELRSPMAFWNGRLEERASILKDLWHEIASDLRLEESAIDFKPAPTKIVETSSYRIAAKIRGVERNFYLSVPASFFDALQRQLPSQPAGPNWDRIAPHIAWRRFICLGEQRLSIEELKNLAPGMLVVLPHNTAAYIEDRDTGRRWQLVKVARPTEGRTLRIGPVIPATIRQGDNVEELSNLTDACVPVKLQIVLDLPLITLEELKGYQEGRDLPVDLADGCDVRLAINGRILGKGKLVSKDKSDPIGVKFVCWTL